MLLLATDAARCISIGEDLPEGLRLERDESLEEASPVVKFRCFEAGRVQTAGTGKLTVVDDVFSLEGGHSQNYAMCVCDVPFPETGVHSISAKVEQMGDCAGIGVVTSFDEAMQHDNGSKAWIGNGASGWCLFNDGDCCHGGSWNSGSQRFGSGKTVTIEIDMDNGTFTPSVDGNRRPNAYRDLPKRLYFAVAMRPNGRMRIDASGCGGSVQGGVSGTWASMVKRTYANSSPAAGMQVPPGWALMDLGRWSNKDDAELVVFMNHISTEVKKRLDLPLLEEMARSGELKKYPRLDGRPLAQILKRTVVLERLSSAVQQVN
jgi:hypothetical protein